MRRGGWRVDADGARREPARRLFFALWPDDAQRSALAQAIAKPIRHCGGRPVPTPSVHVTLAFLGSVLEARLGELRAIAGATAHAWPAEALPLQLTFDRLVHWAKPQILCALGSEAELGSGNVAPSEGTSSRSVAALAATLKDQTAAAGFSPDLKPFRAHVTVARKVRHAPAANSLPALAWSFDAFALIESRTDSSGAVYSVVESYALVKVAKEPG